MPCVSLSKVGDIVMLRAAGFPSANGILPPFRVKCDLKDVSENLDPNADVSCTNCLERGIRCKDDFKDDNNKKQLRRGKRINQLELE